MECYVEMMGTGGEWGQDIAVLKDNIDSDSLPHTSHCYFCECKVDVKPNQNLNKVKTEFIINFFSMCKTLHTYT